MDYPHSKYPFKYIYSVYDLLELSDKYDLTIVHQKCVEFVIDCKDDPFFQLRIADKHELKGIEVIIPAFYSIKTCWTDKIKAQMHFRAI